MLRCLALALAAAALAGCAAGPQDDVAAMAAAALPPTADVRARLATDGQGLLLYPDAVQAPEISFVGTTSAGSRWVCVRVLASTAAGGLARRQAIAVLSPDATLIGTQTNCPACAEPGLRWLPFPELGRDTGIAASASPWQSRAP